MNYDNLASTYDRRFVDDSTAGVGEVLAALLQAQQATTVLEVGCGSGHWLAGLPAAVSRRYGLDLSAGMLQQARKKQVPAQWTRGRARCLPFAAGTFAVVYCVNAIHHFADPRRFIAEACRVLQPGGVLAIIGSDPHDPRERWYLYDYFPGTCETDLARFPAREMLQQWMADAGLQGIERELAERIVSVHRGRAVLEDPFLQQHACSQLALLIAEAYQAGVERLKAALARAELRGETLVFRTDIRLVLLAGYKGGAG